MAARAAFALAVGCAQDEHLVLLFELHVVVVVQNNIAHRQVRKVLITFLLVISDWHLRKNAIDKVTRYN